MSEIVEKFNKHISYKYFVHVKDKSVTLREENEGGKKGAYNVKFAIDDELIVIKDVEEMKKRTNSNYIVDPPSDCDFILISIMKRKLYFVELKDTKVNHEEVKNQLVAGVKWADHLLFCANLNSLIDESWTKVNICVRHDYARPSLGKIKPEQIQGEKVYFVRGNTFTLNKFR